MLSRIKYLQKSRRITNEMLAKESGLSVWSVCKQLHGVYKLNIDVVFALLRLCPDVSADWLLLGRGDLAHADARDIINRIDILESRILSTDSNICGEIQPQQAGSKSGPQ